MHGPGPEGLHHECMALALKEIITSARPGPGPGPEFMALDGAGSRCTHSSRSLETESLTSVSSLGAINLAIATRTRISRNSNLGAEINNGRRGVFISHGQHDHRLLRACPTSHPYGMHSTCEPECVCRHHWHVNPGCRVYGLWFVV